ncbi:unnamed protein product, partial [Closterium sp. NIES-64]
TLLPHFPSHPPSRPSSQQHPFVPVNRSASLLRSDSQRRLRRFLSRSRQLSLRLTPGQALNTPGAFPGNPATAPGSHGNPLALAAAAAMAAGVPEPPKNPLEVALEQGGGNMEMEHRAVGTGFVMGMEGLLEAFETRMDEEEWPKQRVALICVEATFQVGKRGNGGRRENIGGEEKRWGEGEECELLLDDLFDTLESFPQLLTLNSDTPNAKTECELLLLLLDDLFDTLESYPQLLHDMRFALRLPMGVHEQQQNRLARSRGVAASAVREALESP